MKAVNVKLVLQFDHFGDEGEVTREMVKSYVETVNVTLSSHGSSEPQLYFNDESEIEVIQLDGDFEEDENF